MRELSAIVTVSDDGGSSGRLRREFGVLPPGDIRNCLAALADDEDLLTRLFQYRFAAGDGLAGHSFGNLFLTALSGITGDFYKAVLTAESVLSVRGRILPATLQDVRLAATGASGRRYDGESAVGESGEPLSEIRLDPPTVAAFPAAVDAVAASDLVLLGPGSLYTSVLPNLLIPGIRAALERRRGRSVLLLNLMTQPGETDGMDAAAHVETIERNAGAGLIDAVLLNTRMPTAERLTPYLEMGAVPVGTDVPEGAGYEVVGADLLAEDGLIRHDPDKLASAVLALAPGGGEG